MGRSYVRELAQLSATYSFAREYDPSELVDAIRQLRRWPLVIVGSGGSVSAAHLAARLHAECAGLATSVLTPLEFLRRPVPEDAAVLLLSAGGRNADILAGAQHAVNAECRVIAALVTRPGSPLARQLRRARHTHVLEVSGAARKDGFLATNSLLFTSALLVKGYEMELPTTLPSFSEGPPVRTLDGALARGLLDRHSVVALCSDWALSAAVDLESKWGEIGLGGVTVVDPRNFAHGRHTGLARLKNTTFVLGLAAGDDPVLAQTLRLLPTNVAAGSLQSPLAGSAGTLDLIVSVLQLTGSVSLRRGLDPGRPRVPVFGRRLYHINLRRKRASAHMVEQLDVWIRRKVTTSVWRTTPEVSREDWRVAGRRWREQLYDTRFGAVVVDYDGTLCEESERFTEPARPICDLVTELLRAGVGFGVATGRGFSVIRALRGALPPDLWSDTHVAMYNGAWLATLDTATDESAANGGGSLHLSAATSQLQSSVLLSRMATIQVRARQLTIRGRRPMSDGLLWRLVHEALGDALMQQLRIVTSGATVDVLDACVSKARILDAMRTRVGAKGEVLSIGDQGQHGGNDYSLLAQPFGLSVDRTSSDFTSCWNIAPVGARRTEALVAYLRSLRVHATGNATFQLA